MSKNPLGVIDSVLEDWVSPRVRRTIHALLALAAVVAAIWVATEGNWGAFIGALVAAFYAESNRANTNPEPEDDGVIVEDPEDRYDSF